MPRESAHKLRQRSRSNSRFMNPSRRSLSMLSKKRPKMLKRWLTRMPRGRPKKKKTKRKLWKLSKKIKKLSVNRRKIKQIPTK